MFDMMYVSFIYISNFLQQKNIEIQNTFYKEWEY